MTPAHKKHESFWRLVTLTVGLLFVVAMVLLTGCASNPPRTVAPECSALYPPALSLAVQNYRAQWHQEPRLPVPWVDVVPEPRNGMAAWTMGEHIWISKPYINVGVLAHEVGHTIKNKNGKGTGEDHL